MKQLKDYGQEIYVNSLKNGIKGKEIWVDLTALLYPISVELAWQFKNLSETNEITLWTDADYRKLWDTMNNDNCGKILTDRMKEDGKKAFDKFSKCSIKTPKYPSEMDSLTLIGTDNMEMGKIELYVTGNETEAIRIIFEGGKRDILLIVKEGMYFFSPYMFSEIKRDLNKTYESASLPMKYQKGELYNRNGRQIYYENFYYCRSSKKEIFKIRRRNTLIKLSNEEKKLKWMLENRPEPDFLAWPERPVYIEENGERILAGYEMKKRELSFRMSEIFIRQVDVSVYQTLCLEFIKKVLFLHMRGILVTDYNLDNFWIDENDQLIMLDCMGYSVHDQFGRYQAPKGQPLLNKPDYSSRIGFIYAEYEYIKAVTFFILNKGVWPYNSIGNTVDRSEMHKKVLRLNTPWEIYKYLCGLDEYGQGKLGEIRRAPCYVNYNFKRRPVLILVDISHFCRVYMDKINECLREILKKMCYEDRLHSYLTDVLIVSFSNDVWEWDGHGKQRENFTMACDLKNQICNISFSPEYRSGCSLGKALAFAQKILREQHEWYKTKSHYCELPTCIILSNFHTNRRDDAEREAEEEIDNVNDLITNRWNFVSVKFEEENSSFWLKIKGKKVFYNNIWDVNEIMNFQYQASPIINID